MSKKQLPKKDKRDYNVFLNTHTVSGIVISIGLYIVFFAGSFAIFRDEINYWQFNSKPEKYYHHDIDYEKVITALEAEGYDLTKRKINIRKWDTAKESHIWVNAQAPELDSLEKTKKDSLAIVAFQAELNPKSYAVHIHDEKEHETEEMLLGDFIYRLHFFDQIPLPRIGLYLAGLTSLFFLFAILTGIIAHWKKIVSNFFTFRLKSSLKVLWTDAHTALGVIGLPFQFMYAVTGSLFGLSIVILLPTVLLLFDGDRDKLFDVVFTSGKSPELAQVENVERKNINDLATHFLASIDTKNGITNFNASLGNYGDENEYITFNATIDDAESFYANPFTTYKLKDGTIIHQQKQNEVAYAQAVFRTMAALHFANYGNYLVKCIYFILGLITCFVIISGVLIWLVARQNKRYADRKKFVTNVGSIYLGICLGLYPAMALMFIALKICTVFEIHSDVGYNVFYVFWLLFSIYAFVIKDNYKINRQSLIIATVFGLLIPVVNGVFGGVWFWNAISLGLTDSFLVDVAWICISVITGLYLIKTLPKTVETS